MPAGRLVPYQNLYRNDNQGGTIDNYTTIVKPQLDQMQQNMQTNNDINGLQTTVQPLVAPQRQPDQDTTPAPQYNPNYQDYPPANGQYGP